MFPHSCKILDSPRGLQKPSATLGVHKAHSYIYQNIEDHINARYIAVAGLTLLVWTHLTTLDEEMKHIWNNDAGVTFNKALFVVVRYSTTVAFGFVLLGFDFP